MRSNLKVIQGGKVQPECPVCFGPHNDEIHDASLSVRNWFRSDVLSRMERPADILEVKV